eukprot:350391-Chlamydomonas_euryale.AAC.9
MTQEKCVQIVRAGMPVSITMTCAFAGAGGPDPSVKSPDVHGIPVILTPHVHRLIDFEESHGGT